MVSSRSFFAGSSDVSFSSPSGEASLDKTVRRAMSTAQVSSAFLLSLNLNVTDLTLSWPPEIRVLTISHILPSQMRFSVLTFQFSSTRLRAREI